MSTQTQTYQTHHQAYPSKIVPNFNSQSKHCWCTNKYETFDINHIFILTNLLDTANETMPQLFCFASPYFVHPDHEWLVFQLLLYPKGDSEATTGSMILNASARICPHLMADHQENAAVTTFEISKHTQNKNIQFGLSCQIQNIICKVSWFMDGSMEVNFQAKVMYNRFQETSSRNGKFSKNMARLLDTGDFSDFTFVFGSNSEVKVHKSLLSAQSPVFAAMFAHESVKEVQEGKVAIIDIEEDTFRSLLHYMYTGLLPDKEKLTEDLLVAADKYQIDPVKSACEEHLSTLLTFESVAQSLVFADRHSAELLKTNCLEYIGANSGDVLKTKSWCKLSEAYPGLAGIVRCT